MPLVPLLLFHELAQRIAFFTLLLFLLAIIHALHVRLARVDEQLERLDVLIDPRAHLVPRNLLRRRLLGCC